MLFLQGANDKLAELSLLKPLLKSLGPRATLHVLPYADHSFHVAARSGHNDLEIMSQALDAFASWCQSACAR
jgi:hypothetical protein